jgi:Leucine-rich repeat (LRR) protein
MRMRSKSIRLVSTAVLCVGMKVLLSSCPAPGIIFVSFNDPTLEAVVKDKLGLRFTPVTSLDMQFLTSLDVSGLGIFDLTGLGYATNLTFLDASDNPISDLSPLATCISLENLDLEDTDVFEISALEGLANLTVVNLCGNAVPNLQPLLDNVDFATGDTLTVDCELVFGPGPDAQRAALSAKGVAVFLCGDCEDGGGPGGSPAALITGLTSGSPPEYDFGSVSAGAGLQMADLSIENTGSGTLTWVFTFGALPDWIDSISPTAGTTTSETDTVTITVDPNGGSLVMGVEAMFVINFNSDGGSTPITIKITQTA